MRKVFGDYTATKVLGKGSFGTVYLAVQQSTGATVALKEVLEIALTERVRARLEMEISCQKAVDSPYVVRLIDSFTLRSGQYIALEYCAGGDLEKYLKKHGSVGEKVAQEWIRQLVQGFQELKAKKIMHRDLKVQNILLTDDSPEAIVKLADFGMSKVMEDDLTTTRLGSPIYMAPEMFQIGSKYDVKADVWSFGIVCYQMLTGELPISAKFKSEIPSAQKSLKPIPAFLSPSCRDLLSRMLEYDPTRRISFEELFTHPFIQPTVAVEANPEEEKQEAPMDVESEESGSYDLMEDSLAEEKSEGESPASRSLLELENQVRDIEAEMARADLVAKVLGVVRVTKEWYGAFALSIKCASMLKATVEKCECLLQSLGLSRDLHPSFFACQSRAISSFTAAATRAEGCAIELDLVIARKGVEGVTTLHGVDAEKAADYLLFTYAIRLLEEATIDEFVKGYKESAGKYAEGVELLDLLSSSCHDSSLSELLFSARKRLDSVRLQVREVSISPN